MKREKFSRTDSDAGVTGDLIRKPWTVGEVRTRALILGKKFEPNPQITDRLESDLANSNIIVLFTPEEVESAIEKGFIPEGLRSDLVNLVSPEGLNDVAVIPAEAVEAKQRNKIVEWFLTNNRC